MEGRLGAECPVNSDADEMCGERKGKCLIYTIDVNVGQHISVRS